jgi:hypothetical protein
MKNILISISIFLIGCKSQIYKYKSVDNKKIPMPEEFRKLTGYDSIQLISFGKDTLYANFCYPNEWAYFKFKKDTVYIHDTFYTSKQYTTNVKSVRDLYIGQ